MLVEMKAKTNKGHRQKVYKLHRSKQKSRKRIILPFGWLNPSVSGFIDIIGKLSIIFLFLSSRAIESVL